MFMTSNSHPTYQYIINLNEETLSDLCPYVSHLELSVRFYIYTDNSSVV